MTAQALSREKLRGGFYTSPITYLDVHPNRPRTITVLPRIKSFALYGYPDSKYESFTFFDFCHKAVSFLSDPIDTRCFCGILKIVVPCAPQGSLDLFGAKANRLVRVYSPFIFKMGLS